MTKTLLSAAALLLLAACGGEQAQTAAPSNAPVASQAASAAQAVSDAAPAANPQGSLIERINNKGTITVGTEGTYAPFSYHDKDGKLTGYDVEVTRAVADKLGVKVEFKETQWDSMMAGLKAGRFDVVANQVGLTSPERQATFDKSEPYSWSGAVLVVRKDDDKLREDLNAALKAIKENGEYKKVNDKYFKYDISGGTAK